MNAIKPDHYCANGIDTFAFIKANLSADEVKGFYKGNIIKYLQRAGKKQNSAELEDYNKALEYMRQLVKFEEGLADGL